MLDTFLANKINIWTVSLVAELFVGTGRPKYKGGDASFSHYAPDRGQQIGNSETDCLAVAKTISPKKVIPQAHKT